MNKCLKCIKYDIKTISAENSSKCQCYNYTINIIRSNQSLLEIFLKELIKNIKILKY